MILNFSICILPLLSWITSSLAVIPQHPRPVVLWHGLGDSHSSPGMLEFASRIKELHPGIFVHSVFIDQDLSKDRQAGFYGNVNDQIEFVADQLASIPELRDGFDAIGLSQGGQFLRAYVEMYNSPPVQNLITFGSQHMGISDLPGCSRYDFLCQAALRAAKQAVYSDWAQKNLVQAQYYRDPARIQTYLTSNLFLSAVNNEVPAFRNSTYSHNFASLQKLVLVLFTEDKTVVPKESSWFGSEESHDDVRALDNQYSFVGASERGIVPMRLQPLYTEDWIGLRQLDQRGDVVLETCQGEHMQMGDCWEDLVTKFVGGKA
ncbi:palmitoyl-protein thioesterase [Pholiota conissans]|uniref:Palmitoyl-protein thioesterase 1 n=1 Tax=Pholiota conissans TaxID=109636 RepID=A0A9P5ZAL0_9AGAR|nr:palmitoyl-protein thioesterase [Pholiota conissans]